MSILRRSRDMQFHFDAAHDLANLQYRSVEAEKMLRIKMMNR